VKANLLVTSKGYANKQHETLAMFQILQSQADSTANKAREDELYRNSLQHRRRTCQDGRGYMRISCQS
jgi:hypothetical protein